MTEKRRGCQGRDLLQKGLRGHCRVPEAFLVYLDGDVITELHITSIAHQTLPLKCLNFIKCEFSNTLRKPGRVGGDPESAWSLS